MCGVFAVSGVSYSEAMVFYADRVVRFETDEAVFSELAWASYRFKQIDVLMPLLKRMKNFRRRLLGIEASESYLTGLLRLSSGAKDGHLIH